MNEKPRLIIYGAGDIGGRFAAEYRDLGKLKNEFDLVGFVDDFKKGEVCGLPIIGTSKDFQNLLSEGIDNVLISLFYAPVQRLENCLNLEKMGFKFPSIIDVYAPKEMKIGKGVYVHETAVLLGYNLDIGDFSVISANSVVEKSKIGKGVLISPGAFVGYNSEIGDASFMAPYSMCVPNTKIGKGCAINTGAIAHRIVPDGKTVKTYDMIRRQK